MEKDLRIIRSLQLPNKLTIAGAGDYDKVWIRDNVYVALAMMEADFADEAAEIFKSLLAIIRRYEAKLDNPNYPQEHELLRPRFSKDGQEVDQEWGNKQHDALGILLFGVGRLNALRPGLVSETDKVLAQKIVKYLESSRYWEDPDNGIWEESRKLHASSLAACIKGIEAVSGFCSYSTEYLQKAERALEELLPAESDAHDVDLALLTLVWPLGYQRKDIVENVEHSLLRDRGVIRYRGDIYESSDGREPEWVMGIPWLGVAHFELGDAEKAKHYLEETEKLYGESGLPESYIAHNQTCFHTPLAWSHAMAVVLRAKLGR